MKSKLSLVLYIIVIIQFKGCMTPEKIMEQNNDNLLKLEIGMSKDQVIRIMGKPVMNESYKSLNGKAVVILFYYTQRKWQDGNYTKDECTPIVFEESKLVGWGDQFYKSKIEIDINIKNQ